MQIGGMVRQQPWKTVGMSRATWYRAGKPTTAPKQWRITHAMAAQIMNVSLRSVQRAARIRRLAPSLCDDITAGRMKLGEAEKIIQLVLAAELRD